MTTMGKIIYEFTEEQFQELLATVRKTTIEELSKKKAADRFLTKQEAADFLKIHVTTLDARFRNHSLPVSLRHVVGGSILFSQAELEQFIKKS